MNVEENYLLLFVGGSDAGIAIPKRPLAERIYAAVFEGRSGDGFFQNVEVVKTLLAAAFAQKMAATGRGADGMSDADRKGTFIDLIIQMLPTLLPLLLGLCPK